MNEPSVSVKIELASDRGEAQGKNIWGNRISEDFRYLNRGGLAKIGELSSIIILKELTFWLVV